MVLSTVVASALVLHVPGQPLPGYGTGPGGTERPAGTAPGVRPAGPGPDARPPHQPGPPQATVRAPRPTTARPEGESLHGLPEPGAEGLRRGRRDASPDRSVSNLPTPATDPGVLEARAKVDEELGKARDELSRAVQGRHPSGRRITPEQAALRLLLLESIRDSAFRLPNPRQGRPEFPLETLQRAADYQLLWSRSAPPNVCVWCKPLSRIFPIKANIDLAGNDPAKRAKLDQALKGFWATKWNPFLKDVPGEPKDEIKGFQGNELLPGDLIWFENPYAKLISDAEWDARGFRGEEGSNVFYLGGGKIIGIYRSHIIKTIEEKQKSMMGGSEWPSVDYAVAEQKKNPKAYAKIIQDLDQKTNGQYTKLALFPVHREAFRIVAQREPEIYPGGPAPRAAGGAVVASGGGGLMAGVQGPKR